MLSTIVILLITCATESLAADLSKYDIPFAKSLGLAKYAFIKSQDTIIWRGGIPTSAEPLLTKFEQLYQKNNIPHIVKNTVPRIPYILHMIWLGSKFPTKFIEYRKSWLNFHPGWLHILWTNCDQDIMFGEEITDLQTLYSYINKAQVDFMSKSIVVNINLLKLFNQQSFDAASNFGEKADILRYEILYAFGGVYADTDTKCFNSLDILNLSYDFFACLYAGEFLYVCNAIIGSTAKHDVLKHCITDMGKYCKYNLSNDLDNWWKTVLHTVTKTGPVHLTKVIENSADFFDRPNIIFPSSFFYPDSQKTESFAIHYWEGTWNH